MSKTISVLGLVIISLALFGCGPDLSSTPDISPTPGDSSIENSDSEDSITATQELVLNSSDNGLSAEKTSYTFATLQPGDQFPPAASIRLTADSRWAVCTALNERYTKITVENSDVLPDGSIKWGIVTKDDLGIGNESNEIAAIDLTLDRAMIKPGQSKLKFETRGHNGSSGVTGKITAICLDIVVKEFGSIEVDTYTVNLSLDLSALPSIIDETGTDAASLSWTITDAAEEADVYGYSADYSRSVDFQADDSITRISDMKFAVGHSYDTWVFIEGEVRVWISLLPNDESKDYVLTPREDNAQSALTVSKDNLTINAKLGDYFSLK